LTKLTINKIKRNEYMIVHVHEKKIIKVGWAINGPFGKEKKNKDKQFEMCYYSVMDEPQNYHEWFLPDEEGERGSMLDDLNSNDVDCYSCPASILKEAKAEEDKVAALYDTCCKRKCKACEEMFAESVTHSCSQCNANYCQDCAHANGYKFENELCHECC
jgi:hypothetical protein